MGLILLLSTSVHPELSQEKKKKTALKLSALSLNIKNQV